MERQEIVKRIKEAKDYGLSYSELARQIGCKPITMYMFINGTHNLSTRKQIKAMFIIDEYLSANYSISIVQSDKEFIF